MPLYDLKLHSLLKWNKLTTKKGPHVKMQIIATHSLPQNGEIKVVESPHLNHKNNKSAECLYALITQ